VFSLSPLAATPVIPATAVIIAFTGTGARSAVTTIFEAVRYPCRWPPAWRREARFHVFRFDDWGAWDGKWNRHGECLPLLLLSQLLQLLQLLRRLYREKSLQLLQRHYRPEIALVLLIRLQLLLLG
jgi:hypothetical protein